MTTQILIIEDDSSMRDLLQYELSSEGYEILTSATGDEGLKAAKNNELDLILLDVELPGQLNGFELCQALQETPQTASIPIMFLTARAKLDDKLLGFHAGGVDYLTKPFTMAELKARIKANVQRREAESNRATAIINEYKENLSQNMSHELLTPMSKVLGALDLIAHIIPSEQNDELNQLLNLARDGAYDLHRLIEDLLLINAISEQRIHSHRQPLDLADALGLTIDQIKTGYRHKPLEIIIDVPEQQTIYILRKHAYNILSHLIENAYKFSPTKGTINIFSEPLGDAGIKIYVQDRGPGIVPDLQERIFDKFFQADMSITRPQNGLGVGLFIARTIARSYGGDITVESVAGQGATFCFALPDAASTL